MSETDRDIGNVEAWAEVVESLLNLMPTKTRMDVLRLAVANEEAAIKDREAHGPFKLISFAELMRTPLKPMAPVMRLKSLVVQVFTRSITNNHSPKDAARLLFARHRHGYGSGALGDYIDDLPRGADARRCGAARLPRSRRAESALTGEGPF
jgi:hypothetical protein